MSFVSPEGNCSLPMLAERHSVGSAGAPEAADRFTLDVIQEALAATADEMFAVLKKTAMSPIIYEALDVGTGVTDAQGDLVGEELAHEKIHRGKSWC
jgi:hypothetical protein